MKIVLLVIIIFFVLLEIVVSIMLVLQGKAKELLAFTFLGLYLFYVLCIALGRATRQHFIEKYTQEY